MFMDTRITKNCPYCMDICRVGVIVTDNPSPCNLRIGCSTHNFWLPQLFSSVEEAIKKWNNIMTDFKESKEK